MFNTFLRAIRPDADGWDSMTFGARKLTGSARSASAVCFALALLLLAACGGTDTPTQLPADQISPEGLEPALSTSNCSAVLDISNVFQPQNSPGVEPVDSNEVYRWAVFLCGQANQNVFLDWRRNGSTVWSDWIQLNSEGTLQVTRSERFPCGTSPSNFSFEVFANSQSSGTHFVTTVTPISVCPAPNATIVGPSSVNVQQHCSWSANVSGGVSPYSYEWKRDGQVVSTSSGYSTSDTGTSDFDLSLAVTDDDGITGFDDLHVTVSGSGGLVCD